MRELPKEFKVRGGREIPGYKKSALAALDALPHKEIVRTSELAEKSGCSVDWLRQRGTEDVFAPYRYVHDGLQNRGLFWGNKVTIAELRARMEAAEE